MKKVFSPFPECPTKPLNFQKAQHQECKLKIYQTIATDNFVILNANQIKRYTYLDFLKENYMNPKGYY